MSTGESKSLLRQLDWFDGCIFVYFLTLSLELLNVQIYLYKLKVGHVLATILFCIFFSLQKKISVERSVRAPAVAIFLSLLISALFSAHPFRCAGYLGVYVFNFLVYFVLPYQLMILRGIKVLKVYFASFVVVGLYACAQVFFSLFDVYDPSAPQRVAFIARGQALTYEPSYYALYMTLFVMFYNTRFLLSSARKISLRTLLGVNLLLLVSTSTGIFFSYPAFVLTLFCFSLFSFMPSRISKKRLIGFLGVIASVIGIVFFFFPDIIAYSLLKFFYWGFGHNSFTTRWEGMYNSVSTFLNNPWIGVGLGGVGPSLYQHYYEAGNQVETLMEAELFDPTNTFTEILGSLGLVGFCAFGFLAWRFIQSYKKAISSNTASKDAKILAASFFISVVVGMIVLQFNSGLFRPYIWVHIALALAYFRSLEMRAEDAC